MIHNLFSKAHLSLSCPSHTLCKKYIISRGTPQICSPTAALIHFSFSFALLDSNPFKKWPGILLLVTFTPKLFLLSSPSKNQDLVRNSSLWGKKEEKSNQSFGYVIIMMWNKIPFPLGSFPWSSRGSYLFHVWLSSASPKVLRTSYGSDLWILSRVLWYCKIIDWVEDLYPILPRCGRQWLLIEEHVI